MNIENFTETPIRLGHFPVCIDIVRLPETHCQNGFIGLLWNYEDTYFRVHKRTDIKDQLCISLCKYKVQRLPDYVGDVIFDSRNTILNNQENKCEWKVLEYWQGSRTRMRVESSCGEIPDDLWIDKMEFVKYCPCCGGEIKEIGLKAI